MTLHIPAHAEQIITVLQKSGYEAYVVGGCVRDMLLGRLPGDWDITTSAKPEQVKALFRRTIDTGIQHGTVTIMVGRTGYEVTTYRVDGAYEDGRHPKSVEFTSDLLEDLKRRDFTINAMAYSPETGVIDAFGGMEDLQNGIIRCVGDATERFSEDALRILRAIRFSAQLGFVIEEKTRAAIRKIAPNLSKVSKERIQMEITKLLLSEHPEKIAEVFESGIGEYVSETFAGLPYKEARISAEVPAEKFIRWAMLLAPAGEKRAVKVLRELKMDNDTISKVRTLSAWHGKKTEPDKALLRRGMSRMEPEVWDAYLRMYDSREEAEILERLTLQIRQSGDCLSLKELAVRGQDLIEAGIGPGKVIGETLNELLELVLEHPECNNKEYLMDYLHGRNR